MRKLSRAVWVTTAVLTAFAASRTVAQRRIFLEIRTGYPEHLERTEGSVRLGGTIGVPVRIRSTVLYLVGTVHGDIFRSPERAGGSLRADFTSVYAGAGMRLSFPNGSIVRFMGELTIGAMHYSGESSGGIPFPIVTSDLSPASQFMLGFEVGGPVRVGVRMDFNLPFDQPRQDFLAAATFAGWSEMARASVGVGVHLGFHY